MGCGALLSERLRRSALRCGAFLLGKAPVSYDKMYKMKFSDEIFWVGIIQGSPPGRPRPAVATAFCVCCSLVVPFFPHHSGRQWRGIPGCTPVALVRGCGFVRAGCSCYGSVDVASSCRASVAISSCACQSCSSSTSCHTLMRCGSSGGIQGCSGSKT